MVETKGLHESPLDMWGDSFWKKHFRYFFFIKYILSVFIDFLQDHMKSPELSVLIAGLYMIGLNTELLGIYTANGLCEPYFPNYIAGLPDYLKLNYSFSKYSHYFYPLVFIGNLKSCPVLMTFICASFSFYDFSLVLIDVFIMQAIFCSGANGDIVGYVGIIAYAYLKVIIGGIISIYWMVLLIFPKKAGENLQFFSQIGKGINKGLQKILFLPSLNDTRELLALEINFPLRIKAAGVIAFLLTFSYAFIVIVLSYSLKNLIKLVDDQIDYLKECPPDNPFIAINLSTLSIITNKEGIQLLKKVNEYLEPLFICITIGMIFGLLLAIFSIFNMFYMFKKIWLILKSEGEQSSSLERIWKFKAHNSIFFCAQFIVNTVFLEIIFGFSVFSTAYCFSLYDVRIGIWDYIKNREAAFWITLIPLFFGASYFRVLTDKNNYIKNKVYFCFWDFWFFIAGTVASAIKGLFRFMIAIISVMVLGYRVEESIVGAPLDRFDTLFNGFYGSIILHCLREDLIPSKIRLEK
ncbi:hypothetical protein SteCoe_23633 [Stentor coeruleus]|uniref:Uncharacterized protein n=1 Tax=Stentor coeruleus TaxID=5963 RepID=A0A1R2BJF8_9CILI|nr:hypothetical protein SteCoe_23633 [Stentor coeruleus]